MALLRHRLGRAALRADTVVYIVDHFVQCITANPTMLRDATHDFPEIGVELLEAVAARLVNRGAGSLSQEPRGMHSRESKLA